MWLKYDSTKLLNLTYAEKILFSKDLNADGYTTVHIITSSGAVNILEIPNEKVDTFKSKVCYDINNVDVDKL